MAVTTGILAVAGGALAVEAFAADVAGGEVGVDFFSAAGFGVARPELASKSSAWKQRSRAVSEAPSFPPLATWKRLAGQRIFAVVAGTLVDGFSGVGHLRVGLYGNGVRLRAALSLLLGIRFSLRVDRQEQWG